VTCRRVCAHAGAGLSDVGKISAIRSRARSCDAVFGRARMGAATGPGGGWHRFRKIQNRSLALAGSGVCGWRRVAHDSAVGCGCGGRLGNGVSGGAGRLGNGGSVVASGTRKRGAASGRTDMVAWVRRWGHGACAKISGGPAALVMPTSVTASSAWWCWRVFGHGGRASVDGSRHADACLVVGAVAGRSRLRRPLGFAGVTTGGVYAFVWDWALPASPPLGVPASTS
jgi:hypothetical protein